MRSIKHDEKCEYYPVLKCVKESKGFYVVFFNEEKQGIVVYSENKDFPVGRISDIWQEHKFKDFDGSVELHN